MIRRGKDLGQHYAPGQWNVYCQRCGKRVKSSKARKEWDGLWVCSSCYDERQPQDLIRGVIDRQAVPFAVPEAPDQILQLYDLPVTGLTLTPFGAGPENVWDGVNTLRVRLTGGALSSSSDLDVLNGANMAAVMNASAQWEIIQFVNASPVGVNTYALSRLLRGRAGTEFAIGGDFPANCPFVYLGQSSPASYVQLRQYFDVDLLPFAPCMPSFNLNNGDLQISWLRRSKIPRLDQDDFDPALGDPVGEQDERYEVDVLDNTGDALRTLKVIGAPTVTYPLALQISDFGGVQPTYTFNIYQISLDQFSVNGGRGVACAASVITQHLTPR